MKTAKIGRGILWTGLEKVFVQIVSFVQGVVLARLLCPEDFGLTAMLGVFLGLGGMLADGGLGTALVIGVRGAGAEVRSLERHVLGWNVGMAVGLYGLLAALAPWCAQWYGKPLLEDLLRVMAVGLVINAISVVATARLTREEMFGHLAWANGLSSVVGACVAITLAWCGCGVWSIVGMGLSSATVRTLFVWGAVRVRKTYDATSEACGMKTLREALEYGWKLMLSGVVHVVYMESYNIVIGKLWSPAAVGLFVRGQRWARLPGEVVNDAVGRVALPALARTQGAGSLRLTLVNAALLWPALVVLWVWAPEIVGTVLGSRWLDCVPYLRILIVGQFFTVGGNVALQQIRASGRSDLVLRTDMWKKPAGLVALVCAIPFGVTGICWALVVNDVAECAADVWYAWKSLGKANGTGNADIDLVSLRGPCARPPVSGKDARVRLSVIVPSLRGEVPRSLRVQVADRADVELVVVTGVSPVGRARNEGLARATGEYVAWVDSDDEVTETWLKDILAALEGDPDVVTLDAERVGWSGLGNCVWGVSAEEVSVERLRRDVYRDLSRPSMLWLYVTKRALWSGTRFDEAVRVLEDYLALPHVLIRAGSCRYLPKMLYRYARVEKSLINTQSDLRDAELIGVWQRRLDEVPQAYRGPCLWGVAANCYWLCDRVAIGTYTEDHGAVSENLRRCTAIIRGMFGALMRETLTARDFSVRDRLGWSARFACAVLGFWTLQRMRHGSRA